MVVVIVVIVVAAMVLSPFPPDRESIHLYFGNPNCNHLYYIIMAHLAVVITNLVEILFLSWGWMDGRM